MSKEAVARQFFLDFTENLGSEYEDEYNQEHIEEEANLILTDLFFSGLLKIEWNPRKHVLRLNFRDRKNKESKRQKCAPVLMFEK
ncbi:MAG: hypothetical protein ABSD73_11490 [Candidatus Bathyarchaeia archaeon]|jgi:hypothetical protein